MTVAHLVPRRHVVLPTTLPQTPVEEALACRCGHVADAHEHYRRGTDCAVCPCAKYHRQGRGRLFRR